MSGPTCAYVDELDGPCILRLRHTGYHAYADRAAAPPVDVNVMPENEGPFDSPDRAGLRERIEALSWIDENAVSEDRRAILLADLWPLLAASPAPEPRCRRGRNHEGPCR